MQSHKRTCMRACVHTRMHTNPCRRGLPQTARGRRRLAQVPALAHPLAWDSGDGTHMLHPCRTSLAQRRRRSPHPGRPGCSLYAPWGGSASRRSAAPSPRPGLSRGGGRGLASCHTKCCSCSRPSVAAWAQPWPSAWVLGAGASPSRKRTLLLEGQNCGRNWRQWAGGGGWFWP